MRWAEPYRVRRSPLAHGRSTPARWRAARRAFRLPAPPPWPMGGHGRAYRPPVVTLAHARPRPASGSPERLISTPATV
jgi:hypothetical protein